MRRTDIDITIWLALVTGLALTSVAACDAAEEPAPTGDDEIGSVVAPGKADDFLSASAQEYYVTGTGEITLPASWKDRAQEERLKEVRRLLPYKQVVYGWFLNAYLVDKDSKEADPYGGFKALTKNGSYEDMNLRSDDGLTWTFEFRQEVAGQLDLIKALPDAVDNGDGSWTFDLVIGRIGLDEMQRLDTDREWYRSSPWGSFNPKNVDSARLETLPLTIRPEPASEDAWLETERLFADDVLTVGIHFGWDYHNAYHEVHSRAVYNWLVARDFKSPVERWEDLGHEAGPLVGDLRYHGRTVRAEVSLFWGRKGDATDPDTAAGGRQLEADMLDSLATREVVIFNGHSGPFYGFALANWKVTSEGDLDDSELATVPLKTGHYQLIVAEGCDTYAIGQAFYDNPHKDGLEDLDVITTTSFSNASSAASVTDLMSRLLGRSGGAVTPSLYSDLLRDLDGNSYWFSTMYGVHGIDDGPTTHPWADLARSCAPCRAHGDCGDGMRCVQMADGVRGCAAECTASIGCPQGQECRDQQVSGYLRQRVCAPQSLSCTTPAADEIVVLINEVAPDPSADHNGDGARHATRDEYVEVVNASAVPVDLSGWGLADSVGTRHVFPVGTLLGPGGAVVVFGGGAPAVQPGTTLVQTASTATLGLNNGGDKVRLVDLDGNTVDTVSYPADMGAGVTAQRATDGDADADWRFDGDATPGLTSGGDYF